MEHEISDEIKKNLSGWEMLLLGMSGGIVPCPAALVVLLAAMVMKKLVFCMAMILSFSAGPAVVLIFIGVLRARAKLTSHFDISSLGHFRQILKSKNLRIVHYYCAFCFLKSTKPNLNLSVKNVNLFLSEP